MLKVLSDQYGIENGHIETVHSYTNDQNLIDNFHTGDRRGRSAPLNMVITSTGAVKAVAKAIPELSGKLTGNAIRVPTPNVSLAVLVLSLKEEVTKVELNEFLKIQHLLANIDKLLVIQIRLKPFQLIFILARLQLSWTLRLLLQKANRLLFIAGMTMSLDTLKQVLNLTKKVAKIELPRFPKAIDPSV